MSNTPDITSTKKLPITKRSSVLDFTYLSLNELEDKVVKLFPKREHPLEAMHYCLFDAVIFRFVSNGYTKKELIEILTDEVKYSLKILKEIEDEEKNGIGVLPV